MTNPPKLPKEKPKKKPATGTEILIANLSLPGSGTILAGQMAHGVCQMVAAAVGFIMTLYFAVWFLMEWVKNGVSPTEAMQATGRMPDSWMAPMLVGFGGVFVFIAALAWAFVTSLVIRNRLKRVSPDS